MQVIGKPKESHQTWVTEINKHLEVNLLRTEKKAQTESKKPKLKLVPDQ